MTSAQHGFRIMCAVCGTPVAVQRIESAPRLPGWRITVWCHGDRDACEVEEAFIARHGGPDTVMDVTAFQTRRVDATSS